MRHAFTEDQLVEQPAVNLFGELGWATISAAHEVFGPTGTLHRETPADVVLYERLRRALTTLNPALPAEAINQGLAELTRDRSAMIPVGANHEIWKLLREGVPVLVEDHERGGQREERVRVADWNDPGNNDFLLVSQLTVAGPLYTLSTDIRNSLLNDISNSPPWVVTPQALVQ